MSRGRVEAFSDGVIAILITIMVLELEVPHGADWAALRPLVPVFLTYVLSYVYVVAYAIAIPLAFVNEWIADAPYVTVAVMSLVPDRRIEARLAG